MKILMTPQGRKFFYKGSDLHTQYGFVKKEDIDAAKPGSIVSTNTGKEMVVFVPGFVDLYRKIKRGAQIIPSKDIGLILTETGLNKTSVVLDAGSGSGALCCYLAHISKKVYTYEIRDDFAEIVKWNIAMLGLKNVVQRKQDIYEGIKDKNLDVICLDLPEPWKVLPHIAALKYGGFLVSYSPTIPQVGDFVDAVRTIQGLVFLKTVEVIERDWEVEGRKIRPRSQAIGHSGFLTFCRRV
jgi:tRNA (adenine57-N1/adenine58-N1)-methyltransferase catalytic subunit